VLCKSTRISLSPCFYPYRNSKLIYIIALPFYLPLQGHNLGIKINDIALSCPSISNGHSFSYFLTLWCPPNIVSWFILSWNSEQESTGYSSILIPVSKEKWYTLVHGANPLFSYSVPYSFINCIHQCPSRLFYAHAFLQYPVSSTSPYCP